jgi:hypothetical protein
MNTVKLEAPWWTRVTWLQWRWTAAAPPQPWQDDLTGLDARTLRDIGAPDSLLARAHSRQDAQREERAALRVGIAAGAWRHW